MELSGNLNQRNDNEKKKMMTMELKGGECGSGFGGILVLGGVIASAALISAIKNRTTKIIPSRTTTHQKCIKDTTEEPTKPCKNSNCDCSKDEGMEGLRSLLEIPFPCDYEHHHGCGSGSSSSSSSEEWVSTIGSIHVDFSELVAIQNLVLEDKPSLRVNGGKEIIGEKWENLSELEIDYISKGCFGAGILERLALPNPNNVIGWDWEENHVEDHLPSVDADAVSEIFEMVPTVKILEDTSSSMQLKKEDDDDNNDDDDEELVEGNSEGIGDSSNDSNAEAIWPVETLGVGDESLELKGTKSNLLISGEKIDEQERETITEEDGTTGTERKNLNEEKETVVHSPSRSMFLNFLLWFMVPVLLLLLAHYICQISLSS